MHLQLRVHVLPGLQQCDGDDVSELWWRAGGAAAAPPEAVRAPMDFLTDEVPSAVGRIVIVARDERLVSLDFSDCRRRMLAELTELNEAQCAQRPVIHVFLARNFLRVIRQLLALLKHEAHA